MIGAGCAVAHIPVYKTKPNAAEALRHIELA
jgi:hypothetical protein